MKYESIFQLAYFCWWIDRNL